MGLGLGLGVQEMRTLRLAGRLAGLRGGRCGILVCCYADSVDRLLRSSLC